MWEEHYRLKEIDERNTALQEGREEGIEDNKKEVIINMLKEKSDYEFISKITGKTIDEIKEIECNINE